MRTITFVAMALIGSLIFTGGNISSAQQKKARNSIFDFKQELSLTDRQEKNLRNIIAKLKRSSTKKQKEINALRTELNEMIVEKTKLGKIKIKLREIGKLKADATYEDIASTRAIEKELTVAQMSKWRGMQAEFSKRVKQARATAATQKGGAQ
jgi:uncharacterized protein (DUF342 family)